MSSTAENRDQARVSDVMSTDLFSVDHDDDIYLALKQISKHDIGRLPCDSQQPTCWDYLPIGYHAGIRTKATAVLLSSRIIDHITQPGQITNSPNPLH
jgi:hypothetical protein